MVMYGLQACTALTEDLIFNKLLCRVVVLFIKYT